MDPLSKALFANKFAGILVVGPDGIELANKRATQMLGRSLEQIQKAEIGTLLSFDREDNSLQHLIAASQESVVRGLARHSEGDVIPVDIQAEKCEGNGDRTVLIISDARDRESYNTLKQQFIKRVTDDLRSPLTAINGALAILKSGRLTKLGDSVRNVVVIAERNCKRLTLMINNILDFERYESGTIVIQPRRCDLGVLLEQSLEMVKVFGEERGITLDKKIESINVSADDERLPQVFANIVRAAIARAADQSSIEVKASDADGWADVTVSYVRDTDREASQVIDPEDDWTMTGIGLINLDMVRHVIELHHGTLTLNEKEGADRHSFWVRLPISMV
ncbi:MAG: PAS domain-containing sensor histidine kinase [Candidatus Melainabacteria bacterium]|nr:PAS domain-containing sensor histidine kinase [Candidatus Melainabacteria bacterium]